MSDERRPDRHVLLDSEDDDWAWRRRIRGNPATAVAYRVVVFVVGLVLVLGGLALVPLPGPGWLIVIGGLVVWASEFEKAQQVLEWVKARVRGWNDWVLAQSTWVRLGVGLLTAAFVAGVLWVTMRLTGVPALVPDAVEDWLVDVLRLPRST